MLMNKLDELYDNLFDFVKNLEILIQKNIFNGQHIEELTVFGNEIMSLCKSRKFNINSEDLMQLRAFNELINKVDSRAKGYIINQVEFFFREIIELTKSEFLYK